MPKAFFPELPPLACRTLRPVIRRPSSEPHRAPCVQDAPFFLPHETSFSTDAPAAIFAFSPFSRAPLGAGPEGTGGMSGPDHGLNGRAASVQA